MRKHFWFKQFLVFFEYVPIRLGTLLGLFFRQRWKQCLEAYAERKSDGRRTGIFINHWEAEFFHRHLERFDNGLSGIAKGTVKIQNYKSVVHIESVHHNLVDEYEGVVAVLCDVIPYGLVLDVTGPCIDHSAHSVQKCAGIVVRDLKDADNRI